MKSIRLFLAIAACFALSNCVYHRDYGYRGRDNDRHGRYERHDRHDRGYAHDRGHDRGRY